MNWIPFFLPPIYTHPNEKEKKNTLRCPYGSAGGGCPGCLRGRDQFGGHKDHLVVGEQQHRTQHSELREDQEAAQSPADQPTYPAGHHL